MRENNEKTSARHANENARNFLSQLWTVEQCFPPQIPFYVLFSVLMDGVGRVKILVLFCNFKLMIATSTFKYFSRKPISSKSLNIVRRVGDKTKAN